MSESLKPCPWCGHGKVRVVTVAYKHERHDYWRVKCDYCVAYGPPERATGLNRDRGRDEAIAAWNHRATEPLSATCPGIRWNHIAEPQEGEEERV